MPDIPDTVSESAATSKSNKPGKKVESRIASLWKKVEDSKKKDKMMGDKGKDKKVWISKGRVIPENEMAFLRPDEKQKKLIQDFQKARADSSLNNQTNESINEAKIKPTKSKSRLSMKLPKFKTSSNPLKKENSFTYTSHLAQNTKNQENTKPNSSVSVPSTPMMEDVLNGNQTFLREKSFPSSGSTGGEKRISRTGSFVTTDEQQQRSTPRSSAIVPPFNYSPPNPDSYQSGIPGSGTRINSADPKKLRRNDSYVSSMGRTREELMAAAKKKQASSDGYSSSGIPAPGLRNNPVDEQDEMVDENGAPTSSVLVTLV